MTYGRSRQNSLVKSVNQPSYIVTRSVTRRGGTKALGYFRDAPCWVTITYCVLWFFRTAPWLWLSVSASATRRACSYRLTLGRYRRSVKNSLGSGQLLGQLSTASRPRSTHPNKCSGAAFAKRMFSSAYLGQEGCGDMSKSWLHVADSYGLSR